MIRHRPRSRAFLLGVVFAAGLFVSPHADVLSAQSPAAPAPPSAQAPAPATLAVTVERSAETATLTYFNRPIVVLRAQIVGRSPAERAALSVRVLDDLVASRQTGPVEARAAGGGILISVGRRVIVGLTPTDIDEAAGETLEGVAAQTVQRLQQVLAEADEAKRPGTWLKGGTQAVAGLILALLALWALSRTRRVITARLSSSADKAIARSGLSDLRAARASRLLSFVLSRAVLLVFIGLQLVVAYMVVTFVLNRFPYTRAWGESFRGFLLGIIGNLILGIVNAIPGLFTVVVIILITRVVISLLALWFDAVEEGAIQTPWVHQETAVTTRRLVTALLWLFAAVVVYPYVPGSGTDAFKGVSVFVGLIVTLGSSGLVNQMTSGFMITYSRAIRVGDFVRIGDVEGTITHIGVLSVKIKTLRSEEITIPNAIVVSQTITDYSRLENSVLTATSVTIGYDAPWRQVEAMLLLAAERTPGIRPDPKPRVLQTALEDAAVQYTLTFCLENQLTRAVTKTLLHANIQDLFNEYGVQIMTPRYEADPAGPKLVAKKDWYAAPARSDVPPER